MYDATVTQLWRNCDATVAQLWRNCDATVGFVENVQLYAVFSNSRPLLPLVHQSNSARVRWGAIAANMELEGKYTVTRSFEISNDSGCKNMSAGANTGHMDRNTNKTLIPGSD